MKSNDNGGIVRGITNFSQKKFLMRGQKLFYVKKLLRGCSKLED